MKAPPSGTHAKLLTAICARARRRDSGRGLPVEPADFLRSYYAYVAEEDLQAGNPEALAAAALGHLELARHRKPRTAKIRVFNPTVERDGYTSPHTIIQMVNDDMPFLVDSVTMALNSLRQGIHLTVHPLFKVQRSPNGALTGMSGLSGSRNDGAPGKVESLIHVEIACQTRRDMLARIERALESTLRDVRATVDDWAEMLRKLRQASAELRDNAPADAAEVEECRAFLDWLADDHFTLLGYREYRLSRGQKADKLTALPDTGLGILREAPVNETVRLTGEARKQARSSNPLVITKANIRATVHRPAYLDHIAVKVFDRHGSPQKERRFLGLYTAEAYKERPNKIPLLRLKVRHLLEQSGLDPKSHRGKALQNVIDSLPRDDLIQGSVADLASISAGILNLQERRSVRLFCRRDAFNRFYSCLLYLPRDQYSWRARQKVEDILKEALHGVTVDTELTTSESALARLHITVRTEPGDNHGPDVPALEAQLAEAVRSWVDRLRAELTETLPEHEAAELVQRFGERFSAAYQDQVEPEQAIHDIRHLAALMDRGDELEMRLYRSPGLADKRVRFTTLRVEAPIQLYIALPIFENMGLNVISERMYSVQLEPQRVWIQDFELETVAETKIDPEECADRFKACFRQVLDNAADNDSFNSFVLSACLDWREAALLRAYCRYLLQTGLPFSQSYMQEVLSLYPELCRALVDQFNTLFDPDLPKKARERAAKDSKARIAAELGNVVSLDEDRILRAFVSIVEATLRTNFFKRETGELKPYFSFKLDPERVAELPKPRPMYEIFVYSQRVEAVHLRCGKVARGGIRWSDRREDFRTEILGLMKAQQVKNTVIVPTGAKGGFVCKQTPRGDREAVRREVVACYRTFVCGMLDITDNIVDGAVEQPAGVRVRDGEDPYLVVAADKGTATFSDIANDISAEYGFWLGDAFASGGSAGYDHKKMGITARGVWEAVKRHFRELGTSVQDEPFTVIGIGDMSGDVFGNGMLLSRQMKLIAAFNHLHIFIDPDPDPEASYAERQRLFGLGRSSWDDYDEKKLSKGGGIYSRQTKSIELHADARKLLQLSQARVTPPELIKAILRTKADLLWNGGIGTYVKASHETQADAADPANDACRVNANEIRCRVVGEGGNLGFTQRARIQYALAEGRINTDFIDNSGGVDSSDREVNIKILLSQAIAERRLAAGKRNRLLADMTEEVSQLVLASNYAQTQALSTVLSSARERLGEHARLVRVLESRGLLDRQLQFLPSEDQIEERRQAGIGFTRPELAMILSYAKIELTASLTESDIPEDPYLAGELLEYFPPRLAKRFKTLIMRHRLRREIIAMLVSGSIVNRMGPSFVLRAEEETGASVDQVARAYAIVRAVFGIRAIFREIEALDNKVLPAAQYDGMFRTSRMVRRAVYWLLQRHSKDLQIESAVKRFGPPVQRLLERLPDLISGRAEKHLTRNVAQFEGLGLPSRLAQRLAALAVMTQILEIVDVGEEQKLPVDDVAKMHFELGRGLRLDWIRERIETLPVDNRWRAIARATLREQLSRQQRQLVSTVLGSRGKASAQEALHDWLLASRSEIARIRRILDEIQNSGQMDFATLSVALKEVERII